MLALRALLFVAILAFALTACGSGHAAPNHPAASHAAVSPTATTAPASPALTADKAMCKTFNANIGNGGEQQIAQALQTEGTSVSYKLARDITKALTTTTLGSDLKAQVKVTLDCALVKAGVAP